MDHYESHPTTAALVIEVADSTLAFDTTYKASLYAAASISDYWVIDVISKRVIVFREPQADLTQPFKAKYATVAPYISPANLTPLCQGGIAIPVAELLP